MDMTGLVWFPNPLAAGSQMGTLSTRGMTHGESFNLNKDKEKTKPSHNMFVLCKVKRRGTGRG